MTKTPSTSRYALFKQIKPFIKNANRQIFILGTLKLALTAIALMIPYLYKLLIDHVMVGRELGMLPYILAGYLGLFALETTALGLQTLFSNRLLGRTKLDLQLNMWKRLVRMKPTLYERYSAGDLKNRLDGDVTLVKDFIFLHLIDYTFKWISVGAYVVILLSLNWKMALLGFIMLPISFVISSRLGKKAKVLVSEFRQTTGEYETWISNSFRHWKEIKALNMQRKESIKFVGYWKRFGKIKFRHLAYTYANELYYTFQDDFINKMNLYFIGGLLIFQGELTIGGLLVFLTYYQQMINNINEINASNVQLHDVTPSIERIVELLELPVVSQRKLGLQPAFQGHLEFKNVSFRYQENQSDVLHEINLNIQPGDYTAIVGRSGSGKSTLIKLILGQNETQQGAILVDGQPIGDLGSEYLYQHIGVVMQENALFSMSIMDNLRLVQPRATEEEIREVCRMALLDDFIEELPDKYNTVLGESSIKLSGGQKQRLALARVLLTRPRMLILDEATSALDNDSERKINEVIRRIAQHMTVLVIAHRYSAIQDAEQVIVLDQGEIVATGTHLELAGQHEVYDTLFKEQRQGVGSTVT
ncbi:ABC transporter ATP-binding protein [Paenibacillus sp. SAF-068]|uniref:ABC transporter ATP-binding protein n=1 Tax=Paenibacillus sp. SAF-068 TaxID=3436864 RepID=UPI003F81EE26